MNRFTKAEQLFLQLYRGALWADLPQEAPPPVRADGATWQRVADLAEAQTCQGLLADALSLLPAESRPPKPVYFSLVTATADAEDANRKMNQSLRGLFPMLERQGVRAWLLKGQGMAQCYPKPAHRMAGDIDVLIPRKDEFERAERLFSAHLPRGERGEGRYERAFYLGDVIIELHNRIVTDLNPRLRRHFPAWSQAYYDQEPVRWGDVALPPTDFDAIFVFVHLARHYVGGGIGLRQVADWMRFLYVHRTDGGQCPLDVARLERDIDRLGLRRLWTVFAVMAVRHLGCPASAMPLYDASPRYHAAADAVLRSILDEGNFGHHDAAMDQRPQGFLSGKAFSFLVQSRRMARKLRYFPVESLYCFPQLVCGGLSRLGRK